MADEREREVLGGADRTWLMRARARGSERPFEDVRVSARSAIQAEAILRRLGLEVEVDASRVVDGPPDTDRLLRAAAPGPLRCTRCGYHLDGLVVNRAVVDCPECGFPQVVLAYVPYPGVTVAERARGINPRSAGGGNMAAGCLLGGLLTLGAVVVVVIASAY